MDSHVKFTKFVIVVVALSLLFYFVLFCVTPSLYLFVPYYLGLCHYLNDNFYLTISGTHHIYQLEAMLREV